MSIQVKNLKYIYSEGQPYETVAIDDISFSVENGEFIGLIGHTGSGKSTLLQLLDGLIKPKSGQILIDGEDFTAAKRNKADIRKKIGLVFQYPEYQLFEETVAKDIAFGPKNQGLTDLEVHERVRDALNMVGLPVAGVSEKSPFDLSGGEKRRVAIAGVLAMNPQILILDEPTAGLDPVTRNEMVNMIAKIHEFTGNITIFVSHNMDDIARLSDKVMVISEGKIAAFDTPEKIFADEEGLKAMGLSVPNALKISEKIGYGTDCLSVQAIAEKFYKDIILKDNESEKSDD